MTIKDQTSPAQIRAQLIDNGCRPSELAKQLGVSDASVSLVISGKSKSARIADAIAQELGLDKRDLWPSLYP